MCMCECVSIGNEKCYLLMFYEENSQEGYKNIE